jgi:flavin-dependent dehydrogenase
MISCTDKQVAVVKQRRGFNLSRRFFDEQILGMAISNGAKLVNEKVVDVCKRENLWQVETEKQLMTTKILIGADGVNSLVRRKTVGAIRRENLGLAFGYFATGVEKEPTTVKFVGEIPGYIWIFPRDSYSSIGIGSESKYGGALKRILDEFIQSYCPKIKITSRFAAMLPWVTDPDFYKLQCAGENWILIGDAAGHTDPLAGEGILYALWSGKLAAEATAKGEPQLYDGLWRWEYGNYFRQRCNQRSTFYDPLAIEFSIAMHSQRLPWIT